MSPDSSQPRSPADAAPAPADTGKPGVAAEVAAETTPTPAETARGAPAEPAAAPAAPPPPPVDPPAAEPAPVAATAPPAAAAALGPVAKSRLRRLVTVGGTLLILFILWETFTFFVAYTDDAYVRSDLVAVAPEVTGPITTVHVVDNQTVKKGDKLVSIDPVPFQLDVNQRQAQIDEASALLKVAQEELTTAQEALVAATSTHTYAVEQQARFAVLAAENNAPRAELYGAEIEAQAYLPLSSLGGHFFSTRRLVFIGNYTYSKSSVSADSSTIIGPDLQPVPAAAQGGQCLLVALLDDPPGFGVDQLSGGGGRARRRRGPGWREKQPA